MAARPPDHPDSPSTRSVPTPPPRLLWGQAPRSAVFHVLHRTGWTLYSRIWSDTRDRPEAQERVRLVVGWLASHARAGRGAVLDIGCGTGACAIALSRAGFHVVGLDFSRGMISRARASADPGPGSTRFERGDFNRGLPFPGGSFDHALCLGALHHASDPERLLGEVARVLRPAGLFAVVAVDAERRQPLRAGALATILDRGRRLPGWRGRIRTCSPEDLRAALVRARLEVLEERAFAGMLAVLARRRG
jgi:ubiquinone/menaquinone biosynthesis C-methylase UbiE